MNASIDIVEVEIADLVQHKAFQVRERLDWGVVNRYAAGFRHGSDITQQPILVGRIQAPARPSRGRPLKAFEGVKEGALVLLAGFHRVAACREIGRATIQARIVNTTAREALWLAAESNLAHGLPLKGKEVRKAFEAYARAGQCRNADGSYKKLREIGRQFGKHHTTIRAWLNTPELRWLLKHFDPEAQSPEAPPQASPPSPQEQTMKTYKELVQQMKNSVPMFNAEQLMDLANTLRDTMAHLEQGIKERQEEERGKSV